MSALVKSLMYTYLLDVLYVLCHSQRPGDALYVLNHSQSPGDVLMGKKSTHLMARNRD